MLMASDRLRRRVSVCAAAHSVAARPMIAIIRFMYIVLYIEFLNRMPEPAPEHEYGAVGAVKILIAEV